MLTLQEDNIYTSDTHEGIYLFNDNLFFKLGDTAEIPHYTKAFKALKDNVNQFYKVTTIRGLWEFGVWVKGTVKGPCGTEDWDDYMTVTLNKDYTIEDMEYN